MTTEDVDYQYWASLDKWSNKETALLMDGKDPERHKAIRLDSTELSDIYNRAARISKALGRIDWQRRYNASPYLIKSNPLYAVDALEATGWEPPDGLKTALAERQKREEKFERLQEIDDEVDATSTKSAFTRERNTMLKLILGLACGGYGLNLQADKNTHAKQMRMDLEKLGLPLDDGTIKKYLDEARALRRRLLAPQLR